jgi:hypothetical protein
MCCRLWVMLMLITVRLESTLLVAVPSSTLRPVEGNLPLKMAACVTVFSHQIVSTRNVSIQPYMVTTICTTVGYLISIVSIDA